MGLSSADDGAAGSGDRASADRGQLILVGSVAIAFIVVGVAAVVTTVLYTENVATGEADALVDEAAEIDREVDDDVADLLRRVNRGTYFSTAAALENATENVSAYERLLAETYADSGGQVVAVSVVSGRSTNGTRVQQTNYSRILARDSGNVTPWSPIRINDPRDVGAFRMTLNVSSLDDTGTRPFRTTVRGDAGDAVVLEFEDDAGDLRLETTLSNGSTSTCTVSPSGGSDKVNVTLTGEGDCPAVFLGPLAPPYSVLFENVDQARGTYALVVEGASNPNPAAIESTTRTSNAPFTSRVVWEAGVETRLVARSMTYRSRFNASVYGGAG